MENKKRTDMEECVIKYKDNFYLKTEVGYKKIILTTDQDLIKDSIQAIDDTFLEWFVKNPSCEEVDVNDWLDTNGNIAFGGDKRYQICNHLYDKIIIPKEENSIEAKQRAANYMKLKGALDSQYVDFSNPNADKITSASTTTIKQETLEEAAKGYSERHQDVSGNLGKYLVSAVFQDGAEWMQKRMYSEEEVHNIITSYKNNKPKVFLKVFYNEWFEQFKKK